MKKLTAYKIKYYERDTRFGWDNTVHDVVLASSEEEALNKFNKHHNNNVKGIIINRQTIDY